MNLLDVIATLIILYGAFKGYKKGFFISLMGFISLYISLIIGIKYHHILILLIQKTPINLEDNALIVVSIIVSFLFSFFEEIKLLINSDNPVIDALDGSTLVIGSFGTITL